MIEPGQIIKNLIPTEPVTVIKVQQLGSMFSITFTGVNSHKKDNKVIDETTFQNLEVLTNEGQFNFTGNPERFSLFAEAERIHSAYQFDPLFAVNCSIVDPLPHQVEAVYKYLLPLPKIRFLLADDTGAGKTIMTGLLIKEMLMRGLAERILIITPGGLTKQWQQDEMDMKFNLHFKLVTRSDFTSDPNIFTHSDKLITSIDFIRNDDVLNVVKETSWDLIIVDEAHKLSAFDYGNKRYVSKRYKALEILASKCEHLLLLTATPHRGRRDTFKNLLQLLDKDIFASDQLVTSRIKEIGESGVNKFFIRRLKEEMKDWEGRPLFKERYTKTVLYNLTPQEKILYDKVTAYLQKRRDEAKRQSNIHVSLALMVMQRRLTSSIYAVMTTLKNRYEALKGLLDELAQNPNLWKQKQKLDFDFHSLDDFDEFDDQEKESLENIMSDPKKFKLFTTAKNIQEIKEEAAQVKELSELAENLYNSYQEEQKFIQLKELLRDNGVVSRNEKLVIFTEHKDTLTYLERRLKNTGYNVATIHGGKNVEERREAQTFFANEAQILIATDAAGEGINLQFCRLLINWDIPWNPNRLEQRMGRIHRYGQKQDVLVFNLVAQNTREGHVLAKLLKKLDLIREQIGNDRVYDVISDIFEEVNLDQIIDATFNGKTNDYNDAIEHKLTSENVQSKIVEQKEKLAHSLIDYQDARRLKEDSDEKRLQPIYIELFFKKAFKSLGGSISPITNSIYRINTIPEKVARVLKSDYNLSTNNQENIICFNKQIFLEYQLMGDLRKVHYINPGNPLFDSIVKVIRNEYKEDMLKGTILVSPEDKYPYFAFFVKSQIADNRQLKSGESIVDEKLLLVYNTPDNQFRVTSPAKFIDLHPPAAFAKEIEPPAPISIEEVTEWCFNNITEPQYKETERRIKKDVSIRKEYINQAFNNIIIDISTEINQLQGKILLGNKKVEEKIRQKHQQIEELKQKRYRRLEKMDQMQHLTIKEPFVLGCAYVIPLSQVEYESYFGMKRDDEVEEIAMKKAIEYEKQHGWEPIDVSADNTGYDIKSVSPEGLKRYIEVKGRAAEGGVMLSENEMNRLAQLQDNAWLYIVANCKSNPTLFRIQNPAKNLNFEKKFKDIQFYIALDEWKNKSIL